MALLYKSRSIRIVLGAIGALVISSNATAINILLTNDDGFETENIVALYEVLKEQGHDVVIAAPFGNQSGTGAAVDFVQPIKPVKKASKSGAVAAGQPGFGQHPSNPDVWYIDSTPATAVLFGIDIVAQKRWEKNPDLLISGPNEGQNLGYINNHSGTVGAAVTARNMGIPAIAVSADRRTAGKPELAKEVAMVTSKIVAELIKDKQSIDFLPPNAVLNINIPRFDAGQGDALEFKFTEVGHFAILAGIKKLPFGVQFREDLRKDPVVGRRFKDLKQAVAGVGIAPKRLKIEDETNPNAEALHVASEVDKAGKVSVPGFVTISVINSNMGASAELESLAREPLKSLVQ